MRGNSIPAASAAACTVSRIAPASTMIVAPMGSIARTAVSRSSEITTPPCGTPPPVSPVLPPSATTGTPAPAQRRTAAATSSVEPGRSTAGVAPWKSPRRSLR